MYKNWKKKYNNKIRKKSLGDEIAAEYMKVKKWEQNKFHNKIWQKKNTYFNENIPKTKYLTLKIKRKTWRI